MNGVHQELEEAEAEIARLKVELMQTRDEAQAMLAQCGHTINELRAGQAKIIRALDAALQWGEALFSWVPQGTALPEGVKTSKGALTEALREIRG